MKNYQHRITKKTIIFMGILFSLVNNSYAADMVETTQSPKIKIFACNEENIKLSEQFEPRETKLLFATPAPKRPEKKLFTFSAAHLSKYRKDLIRRGHKSYLSSAQMEAKKVLKGQEKKLEIARKEYFGLKAIVNILPPPQYAFPEEEEEEEEEEEKSFFEEDALSEEDVAPEEDTLSEEDVAPEEDAFPEEDESVVVAPLQEALPEENKNAVLAELDQNLPIPRFRFSKNPSSQQTPKQSAKPAFRAKPNPLKSRGRANQRKKENR